MKNLRSQKTKTFFQDDGRDWSQYLNADHADLKPHALEQDHLKKIFKCLFIFDRERDRERERQRERA